jgi:hypothetical protein
MVQIFGQKAGKSLIFLEQSPFGVIGHEHGHKTARSQNQHQCADGQELDQLKGMGWIDAKGIELHVVAEFKKWMGEVPGTDRGARPRDILR